MSKRTAPLLLEDILESAGPLDVAILDEGRVHGAIEVTGVALAHLGGAPHDRRRLLAGLEAQHERPIVEAAQEELVTQLPWGRDCHAVVQLPRLRPQHPPRRGIEALDATTDVVLG